MEISQPSSNVLRTLSRISSSLPTYDKIQPPDTEAVDVAVRRSKRRCFLASVCGSLVLVALISLASVVIIRTRSRPSNASSDQDQSQQPLSSGSSAIQAACTTTMYPKFCFDSLSSDPDALKANPLQLATIAVKFASREVKDASRMAAKLNASGLGGSPLRRGAVHDCLQLMDDTGDELNKSISGLSSLGLVSLKKSLTDIQVRLSASMGLQLACSEGAQQGNVSSSFLKQQENVSNSLIVALGLVDSLSKLGSDLTSWKNALPSVRSHIPHFRRLLSHNDISAPATPSTLETIKLPATSSPNESEFPEWVSAADRKLLQAPPASITADAIVAQDGSGTYTTIQAALDNVPSGRTGRYVIHIKQGTYSEYLTISTKMTYLTLIGDGIGVTVITGNKNNAGGVTTFQSATVAILAANFVARAITFQNTAGPSGYQAVALRASGDLTVFDTCSFEGYQDTLYALASRQFYRGCKIYGTVDFIFGNAIAVFQSCDLFGRQPAKNQANTFTAQGRMTSSDPSGYSFQQCNLGAGTDLQNSPFPVSSYFGRPWQAYSRTVFLQSYIGNVINPAGWLPWNASSPFTDTVYYGEYQNQGPGSSTAQRVPWKGVHSAMSVQEASSYSVEQFISGSTWLPAANVIFQDTLT